MSEMPAVAAQSPLLAGIESPAPGSAAVPLDPGVPHVPGPAVISNTEALAVAHGGGGGNGLAVDPMPVSFDGARPPNGGQALSARDNGIPPAVTGPRGAGMSGPVDESLSGPV